MFARVSIGGRGWSSAAELVEAYYLGGQAMAAPQMHRVLEQGEMKDSPRIKATRDALTSLARKVSAEDAAEILRADAENWVKHFAGDSKETRKARRDFIRNCTDAISRKKEKDIEAAADTDTKKARLNALKNHGASLVTTTLPLQSHYTQSDKAMTYHHRMALGLPPQHRMPLHCKCSRANGLFERDPHHALNCPSELPAGIQERHDELKYTIARFARQLGARRVKVEPRLAGELIHPDGWFWLKGRWVWLDVTVRNSCAPTYVRLSSKGMKEFFESIEAEKHKTYDVSARNHGAEFFAIVVDVHGGFGPEALRFFQEMIKLGAQVKSVWTPRQVVNGIYRSIAADICKGNEEIFETSLRWNLGETTGDRRGNGSDGGIE